FVETDDQLKAINDVMNAMLSDKPMDRLICGDVGFGKTEIIMRASYIASLNEKQTIILAPTTILVEQHYKSFLKRFEDTPIIIKKFSRLQTLSQRKKTFDSFNSGKIDILIGTHAILSNSSRYENIGLLVVDEEHKFGVVAKEKLKKLKENIDVISLTATPIPRTLNSALSQIKDLSIIETPPENRKSISTLITEWDTNIISDAIAREIQRGGQIYFVNDEIRTMQNQIDQLYKLDSRLRIGVIHGQLSNKDIENQMNNFINNKTDILVCTSIIESGLDIQNVNTIIINNANKFGLSQLHQIRGRVGRTNRQAFAYLIVNNKKLITKDATKRLEAFDSVDSLGGGLELATHDLEIRGAGELLGEEQSGQIYEVGYAMFTEMLKKSVDFLKTGKYSDATDDLEFDVNIPALIPQEYINDIFTRLTYYKKISSQKQIDGLKDIKNELIDRFGLIPENLENLFLVTKLKIELSNFELSFLKLTDSFIRIKFKNENNLNVEKTLSIYKNDKNLKILKDGIIQYSKEFDSLENQCHFIKDLAAKIN
ncbi:MAG: transcription-repair coupling factor, partial [Gammaproteobacteria bacterium]|nr:transcription-repair coupling factor [Gammaproteobacteria bacterium]